MNEQEKDYGFWWLKFWVNWRLLVGIIFIAIAILRDFVVSIAEGDFSEPVYIVFFAIEILYLYFVIVVYKNMRGLKPRGYTLNNILIFIGCIIEPVETSPNFGVYVATVLIMFLIWGLPNYIYFKHRKFLFDGRKTIKDLGDSTGEDKKRVILFCENCSYTGSEIAGDSVRMCPECGSPLVNTQVSRETWINLSDQEKAEYKRSWTKRNLETTKTIGNTSNQSNENNRSDLISYCFRCGKKVPEETVYCPYCGQKLST